ncbi:MAG: hypothetical protein G8D61_13520 [gamma proteobacterium symbiont of Ctena orbiculata]
MHGGNTPFASSSRCGAVEYSLREATGAANLTDYQSSIRCSVTAHRAYRAISQEMSAWWTPMSIRCSNITLTHLGLTPGMACYGICKAGWDHYIAGSLKQYLDGLGGRPNSY